MDFPFHQVYNLDDYNNKDLPCIFFGMYRYEDFRLMWMHTDKRVCFWTGQDALDLKDNYMLSDLNITAHPKVHKLLTDKNCRCKLVKPASFLNHENPQKLGRKIYAYCPESCPDYHGVVLINKLIAAGYDIVIGNGMYSQTDWRTLSNDFYSQCFIGLCLSDFAGGGGSIIEMGLRGMRVVTNVFDLPNCIPWKSFEDIMLAIELETREIGCTNKSLSRDVWDALDHEHNWLNI